MPTAKIGTQGSINGSVDLCQGLPLTTTPNVDGGYSKSFSIIEKSVTVPAIVKMDLTLRGQFDVGICGPSWASYMEVEGNATPTDVSLTIKNDETEAGFFFGLGLTLVLAYDVQVVKISLPHCYVDAVHCSYDSIHCHWIHCHGGGVHCSGGTPHCDGGSFGWSDVANGTTQITLNPINWIINYFQGVNDRRDPEETAQGAAGRKVARPPRVS